MPKFTYTGAVAKPYPQFLDVDAGGSLYAEPGQTYNVEPAEGHAWKRLADEPDADGNPVYEDFDPLPPDENWKPVKASTPSRRAADDTPKDGS